MIGIKEKPSTDPKNVEEKDEPTKKCTTLDKFLNLKQASPGSSPPGVKMAGDLRSYFTTSPPPTKTACLQNGKMSLPSKKSKIFEDDKPKPKKIVKPKSITNNKVSNGKETTEILSKDCKVKKPKKTIETTNESKSYDAPVGEIEDDVANCSFVSFEDFLGEDEQKMKDQVNGTTNSNSKLKNEESHASNIKKQNRKKNDGVTSEQKSSGDKKEIKKGKSHENVLKKDLVCKNNKPQNFLMKDSSDDKISSLKTDLRHAKTQVNNNNCKIYLDEKCKTVVAEIHHSPVSSPEREKNESRHRKNPKRRSNVVVDSGIEEIKVVELDIQKREQLPTFQFESKSSNLKSFPIFQKKTQTETSEVKTPVFSIFEKKNKTVKNEKSPVVDQESNLKRKINKVEQEKIPRKKRKRVDINADTSVMSVEEFNIGTPKKEMVKKKQKRHEEVLEVKKTAQMLRRSQRSTRVNESTPKEEFEVVSASRREGSLRMRIRAKNIGAVKCDVKTATASKLLKKAKGQSAKVTIASKKSVAVKLKGSPMKERRLTGKSTMKPNQKKIAKPTAAKEAKSQKVASIFTKNGKKKASSDQDKDGTAKNQPPKLDEEALIARRAFLNKDALGEVNRQTNTVINLNDLPEPPLPSIPHILQIDTNPMWNLPKVKLNIRSANCVKEILNTNWISGLNKIDKNFQQKYTPQEFSNHPEFSYEMQKSILNVLSQEYPKFPVRRIFKRYLAKYRGEDEVKKERKDKYNGKITTESSKKETGKQVKRKSELSAEDEVRTKRRRVPWKEESGNQKDVLSKTMQEKIEEVKPVRKTRRKKNVITDDDGEIKECKEKETKSSVLPTVEEVKCKPVGLLWTEKYQAMNVSELIGNQCNTKKLQTWLMEWKKLAIKEKRKMKKEVKMKTGKNMSAKDWWNQDDDSDFDFIDDYDSEEDSDDDDYGNSLCNTKILVGPSGSGKTAAVYACATELGFKVFEVNASNRRTGKQILLELGEATQSHHVARQTVSGPLASFLSVQGSPSKLANPVKQKIGIQNYFKPALAQTKKKEAKKPSKKSVTEETKEPPVLKEGEQLLPAKKITSTSLIFFKDVDLVFGEDKGFISAINSFMETTKRPIIMTASDPTICDDFTSHFERCEFKPPSIDQVVVNLQLICLAENVLTDRADLTRLVNLLDCDVRRCISSLQFWVESGASNNFFIENTKYSIGESVNDQIKNSVIKDEEMCYQENDLEMKNNESCKQIGTTLGSDNNCMDSPLNVKKDTRCFESTMGILNMQCSLKEMVNSLKNPTQQVSDFCKQCDLVAAFNGFGISVLQNNIHILLPRVYIKEKKKALSNKVNKDDKVNDHRIDDVTNLKIDDRDQTIYDVTNHKSDDVHHKIDDVTNHKTDDRDQKIDDKNHKFDKRNHTIDVKNHKINGIDNKADDRCHKIDDKNHKTDDKTHKIDDNDQKIDDMRTRLCSKALNSLATLSENMSFIDTCSSFGEPQNKSFDLLSQSSKVTTGLSDLPSIADDKRNHSSMTEMIAAMQVASYQHCRQSLQEVEEEMNKFEYTDDFRCDWLEDDDQHAFQLHCEPEVQRRSIIARNVMYDSVASTLPLQTCANERSLGVDYFPCIRNICQNEKFRKETQQKRRYLHYLDTISIGLKENTHILLATAL